MTEFTKEQLEELKIVYWNLLQNKRELAGPWEHDAFNLAVFAIALLERAENAEKRMKAWGYPDEDFICLNCGRETPCMTEADPKPGDPGVPCTFDLTYPQMIERMHYHEDQQRQAEAERDRLRKELEEAEDGIWVLLVAYSPEGHDAPRECFATGPLTGDPISDLVLCPACAAEKHSAVRRARERGGRG